MKSVPRRTEILREQKGAPPQKKNPHIVFLSLATSMALQAHIESDHAERIIYEKIIDICFIIAVAFVLRFLRKKGQKRGKT